MFECSKCGIVKPISAFSSNGAGKLKRRCKPCRSQDQAARDAAKSPEQRKAQFKRIAEWVKKNPEKYRAYAKKTRQNNPEPYRLRVQLRRKRFKSQRHPGPTTSLSRKHTI